MPELQRTGVVLVAEGQAEFTRALAGAKGAVADLGRQSQTSMSRVGAALESGLAAAKQFAKGFGLAAGAVTGLALALNSLVQDAVDYIEAVGQTARVLSISTEEASRAIAVVDDLGVSQQAYTAAMRIAVREGITPTTEGLAQMSDHYLSLQTTQERASYAQSVLGRNWMEFSRILEAGGDRIRSMSAAVSESLIVTGNAERMVRLYAIATDELGDSWLVFKMVLAQHVLPTLTLAITRIALQMQYMEEGENFIAAWAHAITTADAAIAQMTADLEAANPVLDETMSASAALWVTLNEGRNAGENAAAGLSAPAGPAQALRDALAGVNLNLAGVIENFRTNMAWITGGGPALAAAAQSVMTALMGGKITQEEADAMLQPLEAAALSLQTDIGAISLSDATRTMADDWGLSWGNARTEIQGAHDDILSLPAQVQSRIRVQVQWELEQNRRGYTGFQHGGSFTVGGRGGTDRNLVQFAATRGERVIVMPPQATPAGASYSDSHDQRTNNVSIQGQDLSNPFVVKRLFDQWLQGG